MTILQSLTALHGRLKARGDAAEAGWAPQRITYAIPLSASGAPGSPLLLGDPDAKPRGRVLSVPAPVNRTSGIASNFLWEKTAYALGVVADETGAPTQRFKEKRGVAENRTAAEHEAFKALHRERLAETDDPGLRALLLFLDDWRFEAFAEREWPLEMLGTDGVVTFSFEDDFLFERPAARPFVAGSTGGGGPEAFCLVTGRRAPAARLHTPIKGVVGAQSSGAALVSFNLPAFESYGRAQGDNAPVSSAAEFAYTSALNWLLSRDVARPRALRYRLGATPAASQTARSHFRTADATVVFWADAHDAADEAKAQAAEDLLQDAIEPPYDPDDDVDDDFASEIDHALRSLASGRAEPAEALKLDPDVRLHVLGLSPNNARLAPRFWITETLADLARHVVRHRDDLALEPPAFKRPPSVGLLLRETALEGKYENVPPRLSGELMRSVLTGAPYPRTVLSAVIGRIRADGRLSGARVAILKAVINRDLRHAGAPEQRSVPVALDPDNPNAAYQLGRLFALIEGAQKAALPGLNATVKDRYFAAACATPARVFPLLVKNAINHLSLVRKSGKRGLSFWFDAQIGEVWAVLSDELPRALRLEEQGRFVAGYYHQRFAKKTDAPAEADVVLKSDPDGDTAASDTDI